MTYCGAGDLGINSFEYMRELALVHVYHHDLGILFLHSAYSYTVAEGKHLEIRGDNCYFQHTAFFS